MSSPLSLLTSEESLRFRQAMYRVILFSKLFPLKVYKRDFTDDEVEDVHELQKQFIRDFNTREQQGLYTVCKFLSSLADHVSQSNGVGSECPFVRTWTRLNRV